MTARTLDREAEARERGAVNQAGHLLDEAVDLIEQALRIEGLPAGAWAKYLRAAALNVTAAEAELATRLEDLAGGAA